MAHYSPGARTERVYCIWIVPSLFGDTAAKCIKFKKYMYATLWQLWS